jgi:hypothetical protein
MLLLKTCCICCTGFKLNTCCLCRTELTVYVSWTHAACVILNWQHVSAENMLPVSYWTDSIRQLKTCCLCHTELTVCVSWKHAACVTLNWQYVSAEDMLPMSHWTDSMCQLKTCCLCHTELTVCVSWRHAKPFNIQFNMLVWATVSTLSNLEQCEKTKIKRAYLFTIQQCINGKCTTYYVKMAVLVFWDVMLCSADVWKAM